MASSGDLRKGEGEVGINRLYDENMTGSPLLGLAWLVLAYVQSEEHHEGYLLDWKPSPPQTHGQESHCCCPREP